MRRFFMRPSTRRTKTTIAPFWCGKLPYAHQKRADSLQEHHKTPEKAIKTEILFVVGSDI